jgi:hypothetical protein
MNFFQKTLFTKIYICFEASILRAHSGWLSQVCVDSIFFFFFFLNSADTDLRSGEKKNIFFLACIIAF